MPPAIVLEVQCIMFKKLVLLFLVYSNFSFSQALVFPEPQGVKNMLFYVQRSINKNSIVYYLNENEKGELNEIEPINMFWMTYEKPLVREELNFIQRKYAYGLTIKMLDEEKKSFYFNFVSYKKKILYLIKSVLDKKYHVYYYLNNKLVLVTRIYIHIEGGSFWTPKVKYIQITSKDAIRNEDVLEKIIP